MALDCSVVIISWNVAGLLRQCLASISQSLAGSTYSYEVIVVDNASHDDSVAMVRQVFPKVQIIETGANLGYAGGVNIGVDAAQGQWILVLNPDTVMQADAIPQLLDWAQEQPDASVIGPQLRYPDGSIQSSRRRLPTKASYFFESTILERWWPNNPWAQAYRCADQPDDHPQQVEWLMGAALLVRKSAIERAGLMDRRFWMYSEEVDWQARLGRFGSIWYLPQAVIIHHEGKSSEQAPARKHWAFQQSKLRYAALYEGPLFATCLHFFLASSYLYELAVESCKWLFGHKRELRWQRMQIYWQVLRHFG